MGTQENTHVPATTVLQKKQNNFSPLSQPLTTQPKPCRLRQIVVTEFEDTDTK